MGQCYVDGSVRAFVICLSCASGLLALMYMSLALLLRKSNQEGQLAEISDRSVGGAV